MRWQDQPLYRFGVEEEDAGSGGDHDQEGDQDGQHHLPPGLPLVQVSDGESRSRAGMTKNKQSLLALRASASAYWEK